MSSDYYIELHPPGNVEVEVWEGLRYTKVIDDSLQASKEHELWEALGRKPLRRPCLRIVDISNYKIGEEEAPYYAANKLQEFEGLNLKDHLDEVLVAIENFKATCHPDSRAHSSELIKEVLHAAANLCWTFELRWD